MGNFWLGKKAYYLRMEDLIKLAESQPVLLVIIATILVSLIVLLTKGDSEKVGQYKKAKAMLAKLISTKQCGPILVRFAWHDSGTYDNKHEGIWPSAGGAIGSIRFEKEITAGPNAGLSKAVAYLTPIKKECPLVSWADLIQMGSALAIEMAGGPQIDMLYGRKDATESPPTSVAPFGLPDALPDFGGPSECAKDPAAHLRWVFGKYNMGDKEIVALSGAHTLGRAYKDRSGTVEYPSGPKKTTKYTCPAGYSTMKPGGSMHGGMSWTKDWLKFDNSYFKMEGVDDPDLVAFPTDSVLMTDPGFKKYFEKYASSEESFFADYAVAHKKLSELGSKFEGGGFKL